MTLLALLHRRTTLRVLLPALLVLAGCTSEPAPPPDDAAPQAEPGTVPATGTAPDTAATGRPAHAADPAAYVGIVHPPVPDSLEKRGGALATAPGREAAAADYAFADVRDGAAHLLWLSELQGRDAEGEATFRVVDAVEVPSVRPGERFLISGCRMDDRTAVAAVVEDAESETLTDVRLAWGVDREAGRLVDVDPAGVECENEGLRAP